MISRPMCCKSRLATRFKACTKKVTVKSRENIHVNMFKSAGVDSFIVRVCTFLVCGISGGFSANAFVLAQ